MLHLICPFTILPHCQWCYRIPKRGEPLKIYLQQLLQQPCRFAAALIRLLLLRANVGNGVLRGERGEERCERHLKHIYFSKHIFLQFIMLVSLAVQKVFIPPDSLDWNRTSLFDRKEGREARRSRMAEKKERSKIKFWEAQPLVRRRRLVAAAADGMVLNFACSEVCSLYTLPEIIWIPEIICRAAHSIILLQLPHNFDNFHHYPVPLARFCQWLASNPPADPAAADAWCGGPDAAAVAATRTNSWKRTNRTARLYLG